MNVIAKGSKEQSTRDQLAEQVVQLRYWQHLLNEDLKKRAFGVPSAT